MLVIIYSEDNGKVSILTPCDCELTIEQIAEKDVPLLTIRTGGWDEDPELSEPIQQTITARPYLIIDEIELPDRAFREQWRIVNGAVIIDSSIQITPIVREIDARRLQLSLLQLGLLDDVEAAIPLLGRAAQIEWNKATTIREDNPLCVAMAGQLSLDIDAILNLAYSLV